MPMILHLRWNDLTDEQSDAVDRLVREASSDPGCWSFSHARDGLAVRATAVWDGEASLRGFSAGRLVHLSASAGLEPAHTAVFSVPDLYAAAYRPRPAVVPGPRPAPQSAPVAARR